MVIKEITYEKSVLTPTGQYGNIRLGAIITYSLEDGEEPNHQRARTDLNTAIEYQKTGTEAKSTLETEFPDRPPFGQDNSPVSQTPVATANVAADTSLDEELARLVSRDVDPVREKLSVFFVGVVSLPPRTALL